MRKGNLTLRRSSSFTAEEPKIWTNTGLKSEMCRSVLYSNQLFIIWYKNSSTLLIAFSFSVLWYTEPSPDLFTSNYYVIITQFRMFDIKDPNFFCD